MILTFLIKKLVLSKINSRLWRAKAFFNIKFKNNTKLKKNHTKLRDKTKLKKKNTKLKK